MRRRADRAWGMAAGMGKAKEYVASPLTICYGVAADETRVCPSGGRVGLRSVIELSLEMTPSEGAEE